MEVFRDHRAERATPSVLGGMAAAGRFAVLGAALFLGGHETREPPPREGGGREAVHEELACDGCEDPGTLPRGTSLVGRRLRIRRDGVRDVIVRIVRRNGAVELDVNGKRYGIQDTMNVSVGREIGAVEMGDGEVKVVAPEYGIALVTRAEVEAVLDRLADAESPVVTAGVRTVFTPKPGTALAGAIALRRMWNGGESDGPETYDVTFVRTNPPTTLAMATGD